MTCTHEHEHDETGIMVADHYTVDFCEHGYGQIAFFHKDAKQPFAVAYFGPSAMFDMANIFVDAIETKGNA